MFPIGIWEIHRKERFRKKAFLRMIWYRMLPTYDMVPYAMCCERVAREREVAIIWIIVVPV